MSRPLSYLNCLAQISNGNPEGCDTRYRIGTTDKNSRDENRDALAAESLLPWWGSMSAKPIMNSMTAAAKATTPHSQFDIEARRAFLLTAEQVKGAGI